METVPDTRCLEAQAPGTVPRVAVSPLRRGFRLPVLEQISADTIEDKRGEFYYLVKVRTKKTALVYHNEVLPIIPGMMVQADILIGKKTVLQYLLKPILKAKQNALTER